MSNLIEMQGSVPRDLGNAISDAIHTALERGLEADEAACVAISVTSDYARTAYGDAYIEELVKVLRAQRGRPLPAAASAQP